MNPDQIVSQKPADLNIIDLNINSFKNRIIYGPRRETTCLPGFANNKGADCSVPLLFAYWKV